jgi:hypothetical protein
VILDAELDRPVSSMVNDLEIPTIGVINGPGFHTEMLARPHDGE